MILDYQILLKSPPPKLTNWIRHCKRHILLFKQGDLLIRSYNHRCTWRLLSKRVPTRFHAFSEKFANCPDFYSPCYKCFSWEVSVKNS